MSPELIIALLTLAQGMSDIAFGAYKDLKDADKEKVKQMIDAKELEFKSVMNEIRKQ